MTLSCAECGGPVDPGADTLRRWRAPALPHPLRVVCRPCVAALGLPVRIDGPRPSVRLRGARYELAFGVFARPVRAQVIEGRRAASPDR